MNIHSAHMKMASDSEPKLHLIFLALLFSILSWRTSAVASAANLHHNFLHCLSIHSANSTSISNVVYTPNNSSYSSILDFTAHNVRFTEPTTPKPLFIVTPTETSHVQAAIVCSRHNGLQIRTRSGGHDYEGISFVSTVPFILIDMINLRSIDIDVENKVAWVQVGATLGRFYYTIAQKSPTLGFPAGISPNVGVGGHISGGGYGILQRKYGLAADNTIDAQMVDVHGRLLDRKSMGEDLFWAIRGGGGASFGVIIAFKVQLVPVPPIMTVCTTIRTLDQNATKLMNDWQLITPNLPPEVSSYLVLNRVNTSAEANASSVQAAFLFHFLGRVDELRAIMEYRYPQLGLAKEDCEEVSWIQAVLTMAGLSSDAALTSLLDRTISTNVFRTNKYLAKMKSDYVQKPMPQRAIQRLWERFYEPEGRIASVYFVAHGGRMSEIPETAIPYPHRAGNLYFAAYVVFWEEGGVAAANRHINWNRRLYRFMEPYVSKSPRQAYMNYRDLDVGTNMNSGYISFTQASTWGFKYFKSNFYRLAQIKAKVDPTNFFRNEQSIPPLSL